MNIKRPSESWEILSDGLWFDWEENSLRDRVRAYRTRLTHRFQILCDSQCRVYEKNTHNRMQATVYV